MTPEVLATLHDAGFADSRGWSAAEFAALLSAPQCFALGDAEGFVLGRVAADEAELLTLTVHPDARRRGQGWHWLSAFETEARTRAATRAFLEVAEDNTAARALYVRAGWREEGRRSRYYPRPNGAPVDAVIMVKPLR
ncbi:ribosomal-protein-alanine N-acetyltransferase [Salinihabitans flavidus]|uniref:Ribosomal-protein-alanine N-acetyltransferase n=1 Tax=Salinihabitans flavidus TaxID=569882 RepID=A0A1H8LDP0_9RHOB|nr:GNAT family N-acetyltransferase [Salinihabitans flavidus]SEO03284.1 ribosomal-protein-alanine N-acetyltransferase [Salinihabitans flavidus]